MVQTVYHDIAAQTITEPPPCSVSLLEPGIPDSGLPCMFPKHNLFLTKENAWIPSRLMSMFHGHDTIAYNPEYYFQ